LRKYYAARAGGRRGRARLRGAAPWRAGLRRRVDYRVARPGYGVLCRASRIRGKKGGQMGVGATARIISSLPFPTNNTGGSGP
jgi:hypothetical protein